MLSQQIQNLQIKILPVGRLVLVKSVDSQIKAQEFAYQIIKQAAIKIDHLTDVTVACERTNSCLLPEMPLALSSIHDEDHLTIYLTFDSPEVWGVYRIESFQDFLNQLDQNKTDTEAIRWSPLYGVLLFPDEDALMADYLREQNPKVGGLANDCGCEFYVLNWKRKTQSRPSSISEDLVDRPVGLGNQEQSAQAKRLDHFKPTPKPHEFEQAYAIARRLGISIRSVPCLIFFERIHGGERIICELSKCLPNYYDNLRPKDLDFFFLSVFDCVNNALREQESLTVLKHLLNREFSGTNKDKSGNHVESVIYVSNPG